MGGCRCTFRDCSNNSANSPKMHFFHFPYKNPERCQKWITYSGRKEFLSLPDIQIRNKVVCETHFRDECFMNYLKERLTKLAVPTLVRLYDGLVLDYQGSADPSPKYLEPPKAPHLLRPVNSISSRSNSPTTHFQYEVLEDNNPDDSELMPDTESSVATSKTISDNEEESASMSAEPARKVRIVQKILNANACAVLDRNVRVHRGSKRISKLPEQQNVLIRGDTEKMKKNSIYVQPLEEKREHQQVVNVNECSTVAETLETTIEPIDANSQYPEAVEEDEELLIPVIAEYEKQIEELKQKLEESENQVQQYQKSLEAAKKQNEVLQIIQVQTVTNSKKEQACTSATLPATKAQLFKGIQKYLSPSMIALVRMEMFGNPDREWKPDEKTVAVELLSLGSDIFKFVRDEWRVCLPPMKDVEHWGTQCAEVDDDEDL